MRFFQTLHPQRRTGEPVAPSVDLPLIPVEATDDRSPPAPMPFLETEPAVMPLVPTQRGDLGDR